MSEYFSNQDWLNARLGRFTASEIHKLFVSGRKKDEIFGQTALSYIRTKAAEILTQEVKEESDFKQAEWGKNNEAEACAAFEKVTGLTGFYYGCGNPMFFEHGDYAGCSPDWEGNRVGSDFKCPYNSSEHLKNLGLNSAEDLKAERWEYYCQLQFSMLIRGWKCAYFVSYDPRFVYDWMQIKIITVHPDIEWIGECGTRTEKAIELLTTMVTSIKPVAIATYDPQTKATIVTPENF